MLRHIEIVAFVVTISLLSPATGFALEGRIAYSADGNQHDVDDWASTPMALAIIHAFGAKDRLVHYDYNSHLGNNHPFMYEQQTQATLTAAECYGFDKSVFIDDQAAQDAAVASIRDAVNASSANDPLWMVVAGPTEVVYLGIKAADENKRQFVTCISHSPWNNDHSDEPPHHHGPVVMTHTSEDVEALGVTWTQLPGQAALHTQRGEGNARTQNWEPFRWMKTARDPRLRYIYHQMELTSKPDVSDAGMVYYVFTGNDQPTPDDLRKLLDKGDGEDVPDECRGPLNEFEEVDGLVAVEAEHWHRLDKQDTRRWYMRVPRHYVNSGPDDADPRLRKDGFPFVPHAVDASGQAFLELGSDTRVDDSDPIVLGDNTAAGPGHMGVVTYRIFFNTTGRYRVWVRANSTGEYDDSLYVGIDDVWPEPENVLEVDTPNGKWGWSCGARQNAKSASPETRVDITTPGFHEIMFSMKDDGFELDKFVLEAETRGFNPPTAEGPAERRYSK